MEKPQPKDFQELIDWLLLTKQENGWSIDLITTIAFSKLAGSSELSSELGNGEIMTILREMEHNTKHSVANFESVYAQRRKTL